ncbi:MULTISPECIES: ESX secretion-associated protein EspG [unclassified Actinopolyspora]|uniref:ESX secretion-associated protein EspG n=1 Tax=Actinopolyspora TaxID=1849 RepID=UPI0013F68970|nr:MULTISPECIES: ESX secretion-associated protein EspG [unclassified Actinopolyspora]NHD19456.1 ESX secretion-associated protein EspG [Actinopolyspora sp. BKK2]NHE77396.1 ESX secretion-associated protein EspG [Actinopolyspora sp. BKK1]
MARNQISISPVAAAYLCERYDMRPHPMLRIGTLPGEPDEQQRREASDQGRRELQQQGMIDTDEVHPFLDDAWHLLAHPPLALGIAVLDRRRENFNAVLVEQGRNTFQAYQVDGEDDETLHDIVLARHDQGGVTGNAVNLLGELKLAPGGSASLPTELLQHAGDRMSADPSGSALTALSAAGVRRDDAQVLAKAISAERRMEALITVRLFDQRVRRTHALPFGLQVFTTADGSYMTQRKPGGDGREWYTMAPADGRKIAAKIDEMIQQLRASLQR